MKWLVRDAGAQVDSLRPGSRFPSQTTAVPSRSKPSKHRSFDAPAPEPDPRELAFYSALLDAWQSTRMERDRSLLTLSSAAIGLLVTLLTTTGGRDWLQKSSYVVAFLSFGTAVCLALSIFSRNGDHLARLLEDPGATDERLALYDKLLVWCFGLGVAACVALGIRSL